jgi:hypothetical protein
MSDIQDGLRLYGAIAGVEPDGSERLAVCVIPGPPISKSRARFGRGQVYSRVHEVRLRRSALPRLREALRRPPPRRADLGRPGGAPPRSSSACLTSGRRLGAVAVVHDPADPAADVPARRPVASWVKPFAAFKRNVRIAYTWEPVIVRGGRLSSKDGAPVGRDHLSVPITMKRGLTGAKPEAFCRWVMDLLGWKHGDVLDDLFPGTGVFDRVSSGSPRRTRLRAAWARPHPGGRQTAPAVAGCT